MKAAVLVRPNTIEIRQMPMPETPADGVVLRVRTALTCGTDLKGYLRGHPLMPMPTLFGHEYAGDIHECGPEAPSEFEPGMPLMGVHSAPCGRCIFCRANQQNLCESIMDTKVLGTYAEFLAIPGRILSQNCFAKPDGLSYEAAAFLEPLACVVHGQSLVPIDRIKTACLFGAGPIGLLHLLVLRSLRIRNVFVVEPSADRRDLAARLGGNCIDPAATDAIAAVRQATEGHGADLAIDCAARADVWAQVLLATRPGGWALMFGGLPEGETAAFDAHHLHYNEVRLIGSFHFTPKDVRRAFLMLSNRLLDPIPLLSGRYGLEGLETALKRLEAGDGIKFAIEPGAR